MIPKNNSGRLHILQIAKKSPKNRDNMKSDNPLENSQLSMLVQMGSFDNVQDNNREDQIPSLFKSLNDFTHRKMHRGNSDLKNLSESQSSSKEKKVDLYLDAPLLQLHEVERNNSSTSENLEQDDVSEEERISIQHVKVHIFI